MNKLKVAILDGPDEILEFLGDDIQKTDINSAELIIMAGDKDISPEYSYQTTKDESRHDPVKDYRLIKELEKISKHNPRAVIVGLRNSATFIDVFCGGKLVQTQIGATKKKIELSIDARSNSFFCGNTKFEVPNFKTYKIHSSSAGRTVLKYKDDQPIICEYGPTPTKNVMISIHIDPLLMKPDDIRNKILRCYIKKRFVSLYSDAKQFIVKAEECHPASLTDQSIWGCTSSVSRLNAPIESHACFGNMVKQHLAELADYNNKQKVKWEIRVMKPEAWNGRYGRCVTFFKQDEYKEYYDRLKQIYDFEYEINESNDQHVKILLTIDACCAWHKIILTQMRYIYQYCMHYILFDALKLKSMDEYKDMDIMDLLNIVAKTCCKIMHESHEYMLYAYTIEDDGQILKPFDEKEFRKVIDAECAKKRIISLNSVTKSFMVKCPEGFEYIDNDIPFTCSWLVFTETFGKRFNTYKNNIKVFKKLLK